MPVCYVSLQGELGKPPCPTVYALVLPHASRRSDWGEVAVVPSEVDGGGFGVVPRKSKELDWANLATPVLLPYWGLESVVEDAHTLKLVLAVLRGDFEQVEHLRDIVGPHRVLSESGAAQREEILDIPLASSGTPPVKFSEIPQNVAENGAKVLKSRINL